MSYSKVFDLIDQRMTNLRKEKEEVMNSFDCPLYSSVASRPRYEKIAQITAALEELENLKEDFLKKIRDELYDTGIF